MHLKPHEETLFSISLQFSRMKIYFIFDKIRLTVVSMGLLLLVTISKLLPFRMSDDIFKLELILS